MDAIERAHYRLVCPQCSVLEERPPGGKRWVIALTQSVRSGRF